MRAVRRQIQFLTAEQYCLARLTLRARHPMSHSSLGGRIRSQCSTKANSERSVFSTGSNACGMGAYGHDHLVPIQSFGEDLGEYLDVGQTPRGDRAPPGLVECLTSTIPMPACLRQYAGIDSHAAGA